MSEPRPRIDTDKIRASYKLSDVVGRRTKLRRAGREFRGLCVQHQEKTPSMFVNDAQGFVHCFGCGYHADIIKFVMDWEHVAFVEACEMITNGDLPVVPEAEKRRAIEEDAAARAASIAIAADVWERRERIDGTPAETYLTGPGPNMRGLDRDFVRTLAAFGFIRTPAWYRHDTGECGPDIPALVARISDVDDRFLGIQRIFLADGGRCKAKMNNPKLSLGRPAGGAIRLGELEDDHVTVVEGPEDGATVKQEMQRGGIAGPVWIGCGTSMLPLIQFPPAVRRVTIGGDNNRAGRAATQRAKEAYQDRGLEARAVYPDPAFGDWNNQLRGIRL